MTSRLKKWAKKLSGDNRKKLYDTQKSEMVRKEKYHTEKLVKIELQTKELAQGEPLVLIPYYIIFAKEIYSKERKYKGSALLNEVVILEQKWDSRGLNPIVLEAIKRFYVYGYTYITPFRLNISLLDGQHILS